MWQNRITIKRNLDELTLPETEKEAYRKETTELIQNTVIPAYLTLAENLEQLKGTAAAEGGLANFDRGAEYYSLLVRQNTGSDKSVEEIRDMLTTYIQESQQKCREIITANPEVVNDIYDCPADLSVPSAVLNELKEKISTDFPEAADLSFQVKEVPEAMETYSSPAYYITPPIDHYTTGNDIYVNRSQLDGDIREYATLAHEGFPGHLYQTTWFLDTEPDPIRQIISFQGYTEGWGTYAELYSYKLADIEPGKAEMLTLNQGITLSLYCLADIGINYEGWTREETRAFFVPITAISQRSIRYLKLWWNSPAFTSPMALVIWN